MLKMSFLNESVMQVFCQYMHPQLNSTFEEANCQVIIQLLGHNLMHHVLGKHNSLLILGLTSCGEHQAVYCRLFNKQP